MRGVIGEFRYALKQLWKNRGYSVVVIVTLALSIGANTAIFSVVDAILLRPLPYPAPQRLGSLMQRVTGPLNISYPSNIDRDSWLYLRDDVPAVTAAVASETGGVNLEAAGRAQYVQGQRVSARYFAVLGLHLMLGRSFSAAEDTAGGANVVVLSYALWKNTFDSDPEIIGKAIRLKGVPYTVIGVLPRGARTPAKADLWTALRPETSEEGGGDNFDAIVRLKDGATWQQANAQLSRLQSMTSKVIREQHPNAEVYYYAVPLQQDLAAGTRTPAMILMWAVGFVLLVACANLAGLALVRIGRRENEIATRLALGATRWAILRQFWVENLILTALGGIVAVWLGNVTLELMNRSIPDRLLPLGGVSLDSRVLWFTAITAMGASIFFGLLPALSSRRIDVRSALASGSSRSMASSGATRTRYALIAGEVALTIVLLTVAGLLVRTLIYLRTMPPGFNPTNVVIAQASLDDARYNQQAPFLRLLNESLENLRRIPGVESAAVGLSVPYERALNDAVTIADGPEAGKGHMTNLVYVTPDYFKVLQIALRAGRSISDADTPTSQPVAVVNRAFARMYLGQEDSVGRHLRDGNRPIAIVGIVDNVIAPRGFTEGGGPIAAEPTVYLPATQMPQEGLNLAHVWFQPNWIVRTKGNVAEVPRQMQQAMAKADPDLPVSGVRGMSNVLSETLLLQHMEAELLAALAGLALLLSSVGIYGLVSNLVNQRERELGIRMALGCTLRGAMFEISRAGMTATGFGIAGGLLFSLAAVKVLRSQLFGVGLYDPLTLGGVSLLLALVALVAAVLPTLRIGRIDPAETLRAQ
ncbi:MAG TPA: ABC transporter permease [Acidobacteriaceae bacterium]|nr:ABC transporter permease [Acidobacteriaceae bacterium]